MIRYIQLFSCNLQFILTMPIRSSKRIIINVPFINPCQPIEINQSDLNCT